MRSLISALGLAVALAWAAPAAAQDTKSSIIGVWKLTSHGNKTPATGAMTHPRGEHPNGMQVFSRSGRMMFSMFDQGRKKAGRPPSAAEKVALLDTLVAQTGSYRVENNKILIRYDGASNEADVGTERTYIAELSGNKLTLTAEPFLNSAGNKVISVRTFERVD